MLKGRQEEKQGIASRQKDDYQENIQYDKINCFDAQQGIVVAITSNQKERSQYLMIWNVNHYTETREYKSEEKPRSKYSQVDKKLTSAKISTLGSSEWPVSVYKEIPDERYYSLKIALAMPENSEETPAYLLVALATTAKKLVKWELAIDITSSRVYSFSMESVDTFNLSLSLHISEHANYLVNVEKSRILVRNIELIRDGVLEAESKSTRITSLLCYEDVSQGVIFIGYENGAIQGWFIRTFEPCLWIPGVSDRQEDEVSSIDILDPKVYSGKQATATFYLLVAYKSGTIKKFSLLDEGDQLSFREISSTDLGKEIRLRLKQVVGMNRIQDNKDEIGIKQEIQTSPLTLRVVNDNNGCVNILVITSSAVLILNENLKVLEVISFKQYNIRSITNAAISRLSDGDSSKILITITTMFDSNLQILFSDFFMPNLANAVSPVQIKSRLLNPIKPQVDVIPIVQAVSKVKSKDINETFELEEHEILAAGGEVEDLEEEDKGFDFFEPPSNKLYQRQGLMEDELLDAGEDISAIDDVYGNNGKSKSLLQFDINKLAKPPVDPRANLKKSSSFRSDWEAPRKNSKGQLLDLPVVFNSKTKSSGYGQFAQDPFERKLQAKRKAMMAQSSSKSNSRATSAPRMRSKSISGGGSNPAPKGKRIRNYPMDCQPIITPYPVAQYPEKRGTGSPIFHIAFSSDASRLAIASQSSVLVSLRLPRTSSSKDETSYMGHNGSIKSVNFSHNKTTDIFLLSSSSDCTARLWKAGRIEASNVVFSHIKQQPQDSFVSSDNPSTKLEKKPVTLGTTVSSTTNRNRPFGHEVKGAQFFYQDKFVLLSCKSSVMMYAYDAEAAEAKDELTRFLNTGKYQLVHEWKFDKIAHNVTALAAMNSIQTPLVLCSTSDKMLQILDANEGKIIRSVELFHEKNLNHITLSQPSPHAPMPRHVHNVFLTVAPDNFVSMWDLRKPSVVLRYSGHVNRSESINAAFSPCMRYFAVGSEDRAARLFDITAGKEIAKLTGHKDTVTSVAFNPLFAQLATGSYDGDVRFFVDPDLPIYS